MSALLTRHLLIRLQLCSTDVSALEIDFIDFVFQQSITFPNIRSFPIIPWLVVPTVEEAALFPMLCNWHFMKSFHVSVVLHLPCILSCFNRCSNWLTKQFHHLNSNKNPFNDYALCDLALQLCYLTKSLSNSLIIVC